MGRQFSLLLYFTLHVLWHSAHAAVAQTTPHLTERSPPAQLNCTLVSPTPPNATCGEKGRLKYNPFIPNFITNQTLPNLDACRQYCLGWGSHPGNGQFVQCSNFGYNSTSGLCMMNSETIKQHPTDFVKDQSSDTTYYDFNCFSCNQVCPPTSSGNMLKNGGFEVSSEYYGSWYLNSELHGKVVHPGYRSANAFGCRNGTCEISQSVRACPGVQYLFTMAVKVTYSGKKKVPPRNQLPNLSVQVDYFTSELLYAGSTDDGSYSLEPAIAAINSWQVVSGSFRPAANSVIDPNVANVGVFIEYSPRGGSPQQAEQFKGYFDHMSIIPLPKNITTTGPNLLENGGFETGKLAPWKFEYSRSDHYEGTHEVLANASLSSGSKYGFFFQDLLKDSHTNYHTGYAGFRLTNTIPATDPNKLYMISFNWRANLTEITYLYVGSMEWLVHDDGEGSSTLEGRHVLHSSRIFRGSPSLLNVTILMEGYDYYSPHIYPNAYLDDVSVREVVMNEAMI